MSFAAISESVDNVLLSAYDRPKRLAKILYLFLKDYLYL